MSQQLNDAAQLTSRPRADAQVPLGANLESKPTSSASSQRHERVEIKSQQVAALDITEAFTKAASSKAPQPNRRTSSANESRFENWSIGQR
jgi:hypothetical protein